MIIVFDLRHKKVNIAGLLLIPENTVPFLFSCDLAYANRFYTHPHKRKVAKINYMADKQIEDERTHAFSFLNIFKISVADKKKHP